MRLTSSRAYTQPPPVPKMPEGMVELMNGLTRDVLLNNPTNVYEFCANHMEKLLEIRDGPSSKKPLTLEQKILKAQEKVRRRAKERQEKIDTDIKFQSNKSNEEKSNDNKDKSLIQEYLDVANPSAPVHLVHGLEHESEVEISHNILADKISPSEVSASSKIDDLYVDEEAQKVITEKFVQNENRNSVISPDEKPEKESIFGKVEQMSDKEHSDEPIFGKVEVVEMNVEAIKELEIVSLENTGESQLQTITEVSDESSVSESIAIQPPIITIGDDNDVHELESKAVEPVHETESNENKTVEISVVQEIEEQNIKSDALLEGFELNVISEAAENESLSLINIVPDSRNIISELDNNSQKGTNTNESTVQIADIKKQQNDSETVLMSKIESSSNVDKDSNDNNVKQVNSDDNNATSANAIDNNESIKFVTPKVDVSNVEVLHDENRKNHSNTAEEEQSNVLGTIQNEKITTAEKDTPETRPTTENNINDEKKPEDENVNLSEIHNSDSNSNISNSDAIKIEPVEIQLKENMNDYEQIPENDTDILFHQSESTENTNEDSSIVESDLSKTDDDSQNNPNMDLETAAVTIQKVFRSFMFKSRNSTFEDATNDEHNSIDEENDKKEEYYAANLNKERRPLGITRMDTVLQTVNEEKSLSLSTDDSSTLSSAATTIQAHVRGFLVRNKLNSSKTFSVNSLANSHEVLEIDPEQQKNKTILNIHIVPEEGNYLSRDESLITSMDLSLDGTPPSSVNLHPLSCDISERRKMLKREDAVQSVSPPSNNSGKLSEDSVKEVLIDETGVLEREPTDDKTTEIEDQSKNDDNEVTDIISSASTVTPTTIITVSRSEDPVRSPRETVRQHNGRSFTITSSDESDVVTPFVSPRTSEDATQLMHSGEFHDVVLPTKVTRNDESVVREFKSVLVYFLLWNHS